MINKRERKSRLLELLRGGWDLSTLPSTFVHVILYQSDKVFIEKHCITTCSIGTNVHSFMDQPGIFYKDGERKWFTHGELHRDVGPAWISCNGTEFFYKRGQLQNNF